MAKPTKKLDWVTDDSPSKMTEPGTSLKNSGFTVAKPTFQNMNWLFNLINKWIAHFETTTEDQGTALANNSGTLSALAGVVGGHTTTLGTQGTSITTLTGRVNTLSQGGANQVLGMNSAGNATEFKSFAATLPLLITPAPNLVTFTINQASAAQAGYVTTGTQTFAGVKTFQDGLATPLNLSVGGTLGVTGATTFTGNVLFIGNFEVQGSQAFLNTEDLLVEDKLIQINYGSTTLNAAGAGLQVLGDANVVLFNWLYDPTLASQLKVGAPGSEKQVIVSDAVQTVSNKKIVNTNVDDFLEFDEEVDPPTPAAGKVRVFAKADKKLHQKDSTGAVKPLSEFLEPVTVVASGQSSNRTIEEVDLTSVTSIVRTLPVTTEAFSMEIVDVTGLCSETKFIRVTPGAGNGDRFYGKTTSDSLVLRRRHVSVRIHKSANSNIWHVSYQTVSVPPMAASGVPGSVDPANTTGHVFGASFVPVLTTNDAAVVTTANLTAAIIKYQRVGPVVSGSGYCNINPTGAAGTVAKFRVSLPVASNFTSMRDANGPVTLFGSSGAYYVGRVYADTTNDCLVVEVPTGGTATNDVEFHFTYEVK